jgi:clumping factor B
MRDNDDDAAGQVTDGTLAEGLGETAQPGSSSTTDTYGDDSYDDTYDEDVYGDDTSGTGTDDDSTVPDDGGIDDTLPDDGGFGDGDTVDDEVVDDGSVADDGDDGSTGLDVEDGGAEVVDEDLLPQDASPLEGVGFILDELRDALLGEDDAAASFAPDPADLATDSDLDLNADGVVDTADLHEAESPFDFDVDDPHHGGGDGGVIDA